MIDENRDNSHKKITPYLKGKKVFLRPLSKSDLTETYANWLNDSEVNKYMDSSGFPSRIEDLYDYYNNVALSPKNIVLAIIVKETDEHIGNIRLGPINWISRISNFGIMIGDRSKWGKSYAKESILLILQHAFFRLNLNKVNLGVITENIAAVKLYEHLGFKIEGKAIQNSFIDGRYVDAYYMGILKNDFDKITQTPKK